MHIFQKKKDNQSFRWFQSDAQSDLDWEWECSLWGQWTCQTIRCSDLHFITSVHNIIRVRINYNFISCLLFLVLKHWVLFHCSKADCSFTFSQVLSSFVCNINELFVIHVIYQMLRLCIKDIYSFKNKDQKGEVRFFFFVCTIYCQYLSLNATSDAHCKKFPCKLTVKYWQQGFQQCTVILQFITVFWITAFL